MNQLSNEPQPPYGDDKELEAKQQPPAWSPAAQQEMATGSTQQERPQGNYQQEPPPAQGGYQQYAPPGSYQQYGYQQYPPGPPPYGYQQPYGAPHIGDVGPFERTGMGMKARTAGLLCYLFGWVTGLIFFLLERESRFVRFHAMQSILFFGILSVLEWVFSYVPFFGAIGGALGLVTFIGWIFLMVKASRGQYYKLPLFGDLADRLIDQIKL
jgi:uncharacterized membrane protein